MINILYQLFKPKRKKRRAEILSLDGKFFDLQKSYDALNAQYFEGKLDLKISWFGSPDFIPRNRIVFGTFTPHTKIIKIHRLLDQAHITEPFISFIIYHEMLHHVLPPLLGKRGRRKIHHPAFKRKEREFQEYASAQDFLKKWKKVRFKKFC